MIAELIDFFTLHREEMTTIGWLSGLVVSFFTGSAFKHFRKYMTDRSYNKVLGLDSEGSGGFLHIRSSSDGYERMPFAPESGYILLIKAIVPNGSRIIHLVCGFTQDNTTRGIEVFESEELYRHLKKRSTRANTRCCWIVTGRATLTGIMCMTLQSMLSQPSNDPPRRPPRAAGLFQQSFWAPQAVRFTSFMVKCIKM